MKLITFEAFERTEKDLDFLAKEFDDRTPNLIIQYCIQKVASLHRGEKIEINIKTFKDVLKFLRKSEVLTQEEYEMEIAEIECRGTDPTWYSDIEAEDKPGGKIKKTTSNGKTITEE